MKDVRTLRKCLNLDARCSAWYCCMLLSAHVILATGGQHCPGMLCAALPGAFISVDNGVFCWHKLALVFDEVWVKRGDSGALLLPAGRVMRATKQDWNLTCCASAGAGVGGRQERVLQEEALGAARAAGRRVPRDALSAAATHLGSWVTKKPKNMWLSRPTSASRRPGAQRCSAHYAPQTGPLHAPSRLATRLCWGRAWTSAASAGAQGPSMCCRCIKACLVHGRGCARVVHASRRPRLQAAYVRQASLCVRD